MPIRKDLPDTLKRSPKGAQETYAKAHDSAVETYGEGERAHRTAFAALKHSYEKIGDRWEKKSKRGPSDQQAARGRGQRPTQTAGGVAANAPKQHLLDLARRLEIPRRTRMTKPELVQAIQKANTSQTRKARAK
ncbi:MAG TPA: ChaB family protein [Micromonosporaceae bacterium]